MDPDEILALKLAALLAAVIVNAGTGAPPAGVLAQAAEYEESITAAVSSWEATPPA